MSSALKTGLDALSDWRRALERGLSQLGALLTEHELADDTMQTRLDALRQRLGGQKLMLAFVAEFSRGKSELINALFFADTGRRVLPATPGRTTMCPVELSWDGALPPRLSLLPITTRGSGQTLAALREQDEAWQHQLLPLDDADALAAVLEAVRRSQRVAVDQARALGFWDDDKPDDNPPLDEQGLVEVPAWRHALINFPHPLLRHGLVVLDTPGLNAIGAEPELTLGLLPTAHATVYLLAADAGVTRSDLAIWRDHLADQSGERYVVLNKIDTLVDPLLTAEAVEAQLQGQCDEVAAVLQIGRDKVFPLSARWALSARAQGDAPLLAASRLAALEQALHTQLLPQRAQMLGRMVSEGAVRLRDEALQRLQARCRQLDEQLAELRSLRGKSAGRVALMSSRVQQETQEFEASVPRLMALRNVLSKQLQTVLESLSLSRVRGAVQRMRQDSESGLLRLGAARAFAAMGRELRASLAEAEGRCSEIEAMLVASQQQINAEFGLSLASSPRPSLGGYADELARIEAGYSRYLGITQLWRQAQPGFMEQFIRMLQNKLRAVFDGASVEVELWAKAAGSQIDDQLRERRRQLSQRRDAFGRIQGAEQELERSIQDLQGRLAQAQQLSEGLQARVQQLLLQAAQAPVLPAADELDIALPDWQAPGQTPMPTQTPGLERATPAAEAGTPRGGRLQLVSSSSALA